MHDIHVILQFAESLSASVAGLSMDCFLSSDDKLGCAIDGATAATRGAGIFAVLFMGTVLATNYLGGRQSLATPAVLMILLSGVVMSYLPGQFAGYGLTFIIIGVAGAFWTIAKKFVLEPGT